MRKYSTLVIDDEEKLREVVKIKLTKLCPELEIVGQAGDAEEAYKRIQELKPEIIFLDVAMPKGSGFDLLARFSTIDFEVIFVTGYNEYALQALKISAVDYLLKPVSDEELVQAVQKAKTRIDAKIRLAGLELLEHNASHHLNQKTRMSIPSMNSYEQVRISDIIRMEGEQRYTRLYMSEEGEVLSSYSIGKFKELLEDYGFMDCHRSHLINTRQIVEYLKEGVIVMADGVTIPVPRRRREEIKAMVYRLLAEKDG